MSARAEAEAALAAVKFHPVDFRAQVVGRLAPHLLDALEAAGFYVCTKQVKDHPVYPETVYVPIGTT